MWLRFRRWSWPHASDDTPVWKIRSSNPWMRRCGVGLMFVGGSYVLMAVGYFVS